MEIKFTAAKTAAGTSIVVAQGQNRSKTQTATITLPSESNTLPETIILRPGERFTQKVGARESFELEVKFSNAAPRSDGLMGAVKDAIKEQILNREGKVKADSRLVGGKRG